MYAIWLPFTLQGDQQFDFEEEVEFDACGYVGRLCRMHGRTGLCIEGFPDEETARALLPRINAALLYTIAHSGPCMRFDWEPVPVHYKEGEPYVYWERGFEPDLELFPFDASRTAIYLSSKRFSDVLLTVGITGFSRTNRFLETFLTGLDEPGLKNGIVESKLRDAANLFLLSQFETSENAQFLTLCTVLEVLAPRPPRPEQVCALMDKWIMELNKFAGTVGNDPEVSKSLNSLRGLLGREKKESITSCLEDYVRDTLSRNNKTKARADEAAKKARKLYNQRSGLVHEGKSIESDDLNELRSIVEMTLIAAMRST